MKILAESNQKLKCKEPATKVDPEEADIKLKNSVLRASVQTLTIIDAAITTLLLIAVVLIGFAVPYFEQNFAGSPDESNGGSRAVISTSLFITPNFHYRPIRHVISPEFKNVNVTEVYNSSDVYWWYYTDFKNYQRVIRRVGTMLDVTFVLMLFIVVTSDLVLARGVDLVIFTTMYKNMLNY